MSRAAFYAHFQDKLALLDYAMLCKQHELLDLSGEARPRDLMRHMLERIRDDRVFYRELVLNELDWRFLEVLSGSLSQFIERVRRECPTEADVEPSLSSLYCAGGMANLVFWWVRNLPKPRTRSSREAWAFACQRTPERAGMGEN